MVASSFLSSPGGPFILYLCSGPRRSGDFAEQIASLAAGVRTILVDTALGGARHDLARPDVAAVLVKLAARHDCVAVLASPPCKSFSALQHIML